MVVRRALPEKRNPLLEPSACPSSEILVERRRLGQTYLAPKTGTAGLTSSTRARNMGSFDYAHLRVPLPRDLLGSGIFNPNQTSAFPESYFLMRRSNDGFISATGMFKAAFPWASIAEEEAERKYQKTFPSAGHEEMAGSVWVTPEEALALSDEYAMRSWIEALLDPAPIERGSKDKATADIAMPPAFDLENASPVQLPPYKPAAHGRKMATPRKPRSTRNAVKAEAKKEEEAAESAQPEIAKTDEASRSAKPVTLASTRQAIANGSPPPSSIVSNSVNEDTEDDDVKDGTMRIEVSETVETNGNVQTRSTNVTIDVPHSHPELPEPEDPTAMIEKAKQMVEEAQKLDAVTSLDLVRSSKRKVDEVVDPDELAAERPSKAKKMACTVEQKLTKEKMTRRALVGLGVMAAFGTFFQYLA